MVESPIYPDTTAKLLAVLYPDGLPTDYRLVLRVATLLDLAAQSAKGGRVVGVPLWVRFGDEHGVEQGEVRP